MAEKIITKSFERLLEKGKNRGFITYEELGKSLGKRGSSVENVEKAFIIIHLFHLYVEEKAALLESRFFRTNISEHLLFRVLSKLFLHQSV